MKLSKIFTNEKRWTKDALARDKDGNSLNLDYINRDNAKQVKELNSFSLHGALTWYISYEKNREERDRVRTKLRKAIREYTGKDMNIREFNDSPSTKFEDIKAVLRISERIKITKQDNEAE